MPPEYIHPGVYVEEVPTGIRTITGVSTSTTLFIGCAGQGPVDCAVQIHSSAEFYRHFGEPDPDAYLGHAVRHFFDNGGSDALVIRIVDETDVEGAILKPNDRSFNEAVLRLFNAGNRADWIDQFNIMCVPGLSDKDTLETLQMEAAERRAFLIADCPNDAVVETVTNNLPQSARAENSAIYFPWVIASDPLTQESRTFPPSGFIAGIYSRTDARHGVWKSPAGADAILKGATKPAIAVSKLENEELKPRAVNCLRAFTANVPVVWGARTLKGDDTSASEWKYVPVRRLALYIEESLYRGTQWVVFEPNDERLWSRIRLSVGTFMHGLFKNGALRGSTPKEAYFVKCDQTTNSAQDVNNGIVNIVVGFAPIKPAEFVIIAIRQIAGQSQP